MAKFLTIDPLTRIEGHLKIETEIDGDTIVDARVGGVMYRGLEKILKGRHPFDAARITQRTCGICHEVHGVASVLALEQLYRVDVPYNGKLLRDLILGLHIVGDHIFHFYQLCLADYVDFSLLKSYSGNDHRIIKLSNWLKLQPNSFFSRESSDLYLKDKELSFEMALSYFEALEIREIAASGLGILGGKVPFAQAIMPGGLTTHVTSGRLVQFFNALNKTSDFIENIYMPHVKHLAHKFPEYFSMGLTDCGFLGYTTFQMLEKPLFRGGVHIAGERVDFDPALISEKVERSFFQKNGSIAPEKNGAYSWIKVPNYADKVMEVGPLARLINNNDQDFSTLLGSFGQQGLRSSVMSRLLARAFESKMICDHLKLLFENYRMGEPTIAAVDLDKKVTGEGRSYSIAARGDLSHAIQAVDGKVTGYRMLVPSAWNFGPSTSEHKGVVESALIGTRLEQGDASKSLIAGRIVRSFDPCIACAVH